MVEEHKDVSKLHNGDQMCTVKTNKQTKIDAGYIYAGIYMHMQ